MSVSLTAKDGRRIKVNLCSYMLGYVRDKDIRRLLKEAPEPSQTTPAKDIPAKRKIKTKATTKPDETKAAEADNPLADLLGPVMDEPSTWTKDQDAKIIKFKADHPAGKWDDLANEMNMAGKGGDLKGRFAELKKEGKVDAAAGAGAKKDEPKKEDMKEEKKDENNGDSVDKKGGKKGKKEEAAAGADKGGDGAAPGKKKGRNEAAKDAAAHFTAAELEMLRNEYATAEADKYGWVASRFYDHTGKAVASEVVKAALSA